MARRCARLLLTVVVAVVVAVVPAVACSGGAGGGGSDDVTVFAAASLTETFTAIGEALERGDEALQPTFSFAGSQALVRQVSSGAPADVVATADERTMQRLVDDDLVEVPRVFATNRLEIAVAPGNPRGVARLADLARTDLSVVVADPSVPVGAYTQQLLSRAGVAVRPVSQELDVKAALAKVTSGEADATVVYVTDVRAAGGAATGVAIPADVNVVARYPIAVVRRAPHPDAARAFVDAVLADDGQRVLRDAGFGAPG